MKTPTDIPTMGEKVRAVFPNSKWGTGVVIASDPDAVAKDKKPLTVRRDGDGQIGHFHFDAEYGQQVERV